MSVGGYKKSLHSLTYLRAPTSIRLDSQSSSHSLLEEDFLIENESRTHWASNRNMSPSLRFCPRSERQGLIRQQDKLYAFISVVMDPFRGGSRSLEFRIKAKVESRKQKPNIKTK